MKKRKLGIIGGSGLYKMDGFEKARWKKIKTPWGEPGPYEKSVLNTPILESNFKTSKDFKGIDILRALRSFDPCMPCTTHTMVEGSDHVFTREVTTCACGVN